MVRLSAHAQYEILFLCRTYPRTAHTRASALWENDRPLHLKIEKTGSRLKHVPGRLVCVSSSPPCRTCTHAGAPCWLPAAQPQQGCRSTMRHTRACATACIEPL